MGGYKDFQRIAIGIGRPESRLPADVANYVLDNFNEIERENLMESYKEVIKLLS
jgi:peptidyl-tRNA hydrolase